MPDQYNFTCGTPTVQQINWRNLTTAATTMGRAFRRTGAAMGDLTAALMQHVIARREGKFYLDGPGLQDDCPASSRLMDDTDTAIEAAEHLFRESTMPRVEVVDWNAPPMTDPRVATVKGQRQNPEIIEGSDSS